MCSILCLDYTGKKAEFANRIVDELRDLRIIEEAGQKEEDEEENDDEDDELGNDGSESGNSGQGDNDGSSERGDERQISAARVDYPFSFHYKNIENTIRQFDGSVGLFIRKWIEELKKQRHS